MVSDWRNAWKWFSIHVAMIESLLNAAQAAFPYVQTLITPQQSALINAGLGIGIILARLIDQPNA